MGLVSEQINVEYDAATPCATKFIWKSRMNKIRLANSDDLNALYQITLKTGNSGRDASHLYTDPKILGHIYSAPYLKFAPELAVVVERSNEVLGYCVGTSDTLNFEKQLETDWWPSLRQRYRKPEEGRRLDWSVEEHCRQIIHQPESTPKQIVNQFPAHLHMNLLPELQGMGVGPALLNFWFQQAHLLEVKAVHLGASASNQKAIQFWSNQGFENLAGVTEVLSPDTVWMGKSLQSKKGRHL